MENEINVDYILSIEKDGENLNVRKIKIDKTKQIVVVLKEMEEFDEVLNLQEFVRSFDLLEDESYSYCWPNEYTKTYIRNAEFPQIDEEKYQEKINDIEKSITEDYKNQFGENIVKKELDLQTKIFEQQCEYKKEKLNQYRDDLRRYLYARCYHNTLSQIKEKVLMYSSDVIGWYRPNYKIADDILISLSTNFCYGSSSYFYVILKYKGINIIPYSDLVNYYYSSMMDNVRYTREYRPLRSNWEHALSFVKEIADMITESNSVFEKKWIIDEVEKMMRGLSDVANNINQYYERQVKKAETERDKQNTIIKYRNITKLEIERYKIYPKEQILVIQIDKLTTALGFLKDLLSLEGIYHPVLQHIKTIMTYNKSLLGPIDKCLDDIKNKLMILNEEKSQLEIEQEKCDKELQQIQEEVEKQLLKIDTNYKLLKTDDLKKFYLLNKCRQNEFYKKFNVKLNEIKNKCQSIMCEITERERLEKHISEKKQYIMAKLKEFAAYN